MQEPLFIQPVLQEKIWGGTKLRDIYGYDIPSNQTGECWAISAHADGVGRVASGVHAGTHLDKLYASHPELFGNPSTPDFPLLVKIIDATNDLSVQVHPDDAYAREHEGELGKSECWYVIDAEADAEIVYGHHAKTKEEFERMVSQGKWDKLLRKIKVSRGDFFYVPSGTIHAIGAGITILETQQSSNTTYRVYDYEREDQQGKKRDLHIQQSIAVANIPHSDPVLQFSVKDKEEASITTLIEEKHFSVHHWQVNQYVSFEKKCAYALFSVLEGNGTLRIVNKEYQLKKGHHFILPATVEKCEVYGTLELMSSHPGTQ